MAPGSIDVLLRELTAEHGCTSVLLHPHADCHGGHHDRRSCDSYLFVLDATPIFRVIGKNGESMPVRVMGPNLAGREQPFDRVTFYYGGESVIRFIENHAEGTLPDPEQLFGRMFGLPGEE